MQRYKPPKRRSLYKQQDDTTSSKPTEKTGTQTSRKAAGVLSCSQLNTLAVITILSASGMVYLMGDKEGIKSAAPHVFLLASQVFAEEVAFSDRFQRRIRVFVPVFYNARSISTLMDWLNNEIYKVESEYRGSARWLYLGRAIAAVNMALWCFNLFGFLLPLHLPKALKSITLLQGISRRPGTCFQLSLY